MIQIGVLQGLIKRLLDPSANKGLLSSYCQFLPVLFPLFLFGVGRGVDWSFIVGYIYIYIYVYIYICKYSHYIPIISPSLNVIVHAFPIKSPMISIEIVVGAIPNWLMVWNCFFHNIWDVILPISPNWLIFFKMVKTTNQPIIFPFFPFFPYLIYPIKFPRYFRHCIPLPELPNDAIPPWIPGKFLALFVCGSAVLLVAWWKPGSKNHINRNSSEFQDPKMEVLYHITYFVGIFPYIGLI